MSDKYLCNEKQLLLNAIGTEACWGWSPAIDFTELLADRLPSRQTANARDESGAPAPSSAILPAVVSDDDDDALMAALIAQIQCKSTAKDASDSGVDTVRVLLAGACDIRHIFCTLSALRATSNTMAATPPPPTYHFYIYEPNLRLHCRHLFFLQWLLDSMFALEELEERVLMFLDVFGNACTREMTAAQSRNVVQHLLQSLEHGGDGAKGLASMLNFSEMKMKERDFVEQQLAQWLRDGAQADITAQWSRRLRQEMAERFDNRDNIIDWDFVFRLTDYTNLLKFPEYRTWRNTGIAYDVSHINPRRGFEYNYTVANKTLCHFDRRGHGVYCGDIKNGPFFALGARTENAHIRYRTADGQCKYGNGVVAMHNVRAWVYTLMTGLRWSWADHAFAWDDEKHYNYLPPGTPSGVAYQASFPAVKFHLVGLDFDRLLLHQREGKLGGRFDAAFVGTSCTQYMKPAFFTEAMASHGVVVAETAKFVVDADDAAKAAFEAKITELAAAAGWRPEARLTASLHTGQPKPRATEAHETAAQALSRKRYDMPHQVALTKDGK